MCFNLFFRIFCGKRLPPVNGSRFLISASDATTLRSWINFPFVNHFQNFFCWSFKCLWTIENEWQIYAINVLLLQPTLSLPMFPDKSTYIFLLTLQPLTVKPVSYKSIMQWTKLVENDFLLILKISLVPYQHNNHVCVGILIYICQPLANIFKSFTARDVKNQEGSSCPTNNRNLSKKLGFYSHPL